MECSPYYRKELLPVVVACVAWGKEWNGMTIKIKCDNAAVVAIINSGRSKNTGQQLQLGETKQCQQMDLRDLMKSANKTFWKIKLNKTLQLADVQSGC